ncbi:beta-1,4-mannosyltransferas-like protein [Clohesyomyces aquaticus]|uniref:Chitobiosyldiphosphodolichol beta-mannosyltransferase n=1 Tax=Clohesyomyces aquaticus TaxID=1231657 RepID=A0A1Y1YAG3_9PLEO|nr:beta-1,4-mannosyltransferas-like protein [Clohesyomyces aquaticus]
MHVFTNSPNPWFEPSLFLAVLVGIISIICYLTLPQPYLPLADKPVLDPMEGKKNNSSIKEKKKPGWFRRRRTIQVVVLGDIGRSPRMQYHAISLAKHGARVFLIGYKESEIHPDVLSSPRIKIVALNPAPTFLRSSSKLMFPILAPLKALWQAQDLYRALGYGTPPPRWVLVQNPPSIPTLAIAALVCWFRQTELVIDWHNFGYSILAMKLGARHPLVRISALYENVCARLASGHFTVTHAMARVLKRKYRVTAHTLHDRPAALFRPITVHERAQFLATLPDTAQYAEELSPTAKSPLRLVVSSTSWTADEDFSVLLEALSAYSAQATSKPQLPKILAIITGKGPLKEHYLSKIQELNQEKKLLNVIIRTAWLTPEDYATLLGAADLGVSLHTSSSGVDLPMKVVDMFGAGLPVVGWGNFEAWPELVKEDVNGKGFGTADELFRLFVSLFENSNGLLSVLKRGATEESEHRWDEEWDRVGGKLFKLVKREEDSSSSSSGCFDY